MRIVLDTNVFVSGIFWKGSPAKILSKWREGRLTLCVTPSILEEYTGVGDRLSQKYPGVDITYFTRLVAVESEVFPDIKLPRPVSRDSDDNKFIAAAVSSGANAVVSGDQDLLVLKNYHSIPILDPRSFLVLWGQ